MAVRARTHKRHQPRKSRGTARVPRSAFAESFQVCTDYYGRTCITILKANHAVRYIVNDDMLRIRQENRQEFARAWTPINYALDQAAAIFCHYARTCFGATEEAWQWLQQIIIRVHQHGENLPIIEDNEMANTRPLRDNAFKDELSRAVAGTPAPAPAKGRGNVPAPAAPVATAPTSGRARRGQTAPPPAVSPAETNGNGTAPRKRGETSAAARFKELIMTGEMSDDEIFAAVQDEFSLSDDKRNYVGWYRNWLRKNGYNPPDKLVAEPTEAAAAPQPKGAVSRRKAAPTPPEEPPAPPVGGRRSRK